MYQIACWRIIEQYSIFMLSGLNMWITCRISFVINYFWRRNQQPIHFDSFGPAFYYLGRNFVAQWIWLISFFFNMNLSQIICLYNLINLRRKSNIKQYSWLENSIFPYANLSQLEVLIILCENGLTIMIKTLASRFKDKDKTNCC